MDFGYMYSITIQLRISMIMRTYTRVTKATEVPAAPLVTAKVFLSLVTGLAIVEGLNHPGPTLDYPITFWGVN